MLLLAELRPCRANRPLPQYAPTGAKRHEGTRLSTRPAPRPARLPSWPPPPGPARPRRPLAGPLEAEPEPPHGPAVAALGPAGAGVGAAPAGAGRGGAGRRYGPSLAAGGVGRGRGVRLRPGPPPGNGAPEWFPFSRASPGRACRAVPGGAECTSGCGLGAAGGDRRCGSGCWGARCRTAERRAAQQLQEPESRQCRGQDGDLRSPRPSRGTAARTSGRLGDPECVQRRDPTASGQLVAELCH